MAITDSAAMFHAGGEASGVMPWGAGSAREYAVDAAALAEALGRVSLFAKADATRQSSGPPVPVALEFT